MNVPVTAKISRLGHLEIGGCPLVQLVKKFGTPLYIVDQKTIEEKCWKYVQTLKAHYPNGLVIYASKALCVTAILKLIKQQGLGVEVASGGELYTALRAGFKGKDIFFHGNNKTAAEIEEGLAARVGGFIVDNFDELKRLDQISKKSDLKTGVMFRVNPGIEVETHQHLQTGRLDSKFGLQLAEVLSAVEMVNGMKNLEYTGLHAHLGSQIFETQPFVAEVDVLVKLMKEIQDKTGLKSSRLNLGGGIGVPYVERDEKPAIEKFVSEICRALKNKCSEYNLDLPGLILEPGRSIVGLAGVTAYKIGAIKNIPGVRKYVAVDGGMADNIRPSLYQAEYEALLANKADQETVEPPVAVAGKFCESGDILIKEIKLPPLEIGDILVVFCTGAYTYSMASNYNRALRPAMLLVNQGKSKLILKRESYEDLVRLDV